MPNTSPMKGGPRKSTRKNRSKNQNGLMKFAALPPLAGRHRCTLVFCAQHNATESAAGAGVYNFYRLNGPYDPDTAVLSASTPGLANLAGLYRSMKVVSVAVSAHCNLTCQDRATFILSLVPTAFQPVLPSNQQYWSVQRLAKSTFFQCRGLSQSGTSQNSYEGTVTQRFRLNQVANLTPAQYMDEADYGSLTNSNPTRQLYVAVAVTTNAPVQAFCGFHVKIAYDIEFYDPYPLQ